MKVLQWVLRRLVLAPLTVVLALFLWTTLPVTLLVGAALSAVVPGWLRPVRLLWIAVLHLTLESVVLIAMLLLWVASGFGVWLRRPWFERCHYVLARFYLRVFFREAQRVLRLQVETVGPAPDAMPGQPLLVVSRHAGPGDSFVLMHKLLSDYRREPRVVLKDTLAWDPMIGVLLDRVPAQFVTPAPGQSDDVEARIAELAHDLDDDDAFVIFPEGGNFTPARRERAIDRLHRLGLHRMASRAEEMMHVLAPKPGGLLAALEAAPEADVLLVAHTGLDHVLTIGDIWRELPMDKRITMAWWRVPRSEIPTDRDAQVDWLYDWWERIDDWVADHRPQDLPPIGLRRPQPTDAAP